MRQAGRLVEIARAVEEDSDNSLNGEEP